MDYVLFNSFSVHGHLGDFQPFARTNWASINNYLHSHFPELCEHFSKSMENEINRYIYFGAKDFWNLCSSFFPCTVRQLFEVPAWLSVCESVCGTNSWSAPAESKDMHFLITGDIVISRFMRVAIIYIPPSNIGYGQLISTCPHYVGHTEWISMNFLACQNSSEKCQSAASIPCLDRCRGHLVWSSAYPTCSKPFGTSFGFHSFFPAGPFLISEVIGVSLDMWVKLDQRSS